MCAKFMFTAFDLPFQQDPKLFSSAAGTPKSQMGYDIEARMCLFTLALSLYAEALASALDSSIL